MRVKILGLFAALTLVAACESAPEGGTAGTGGGQTAAPAPAPVAQQPARPAAPRPGSREDFLATVKDRVFFDYDKSDVRRDQAGSLDAQAAWLARYPNVTVTVEGHCDERGTREYNIALGNRRADAVKKYLVSKGVAANRVSVISYGKERPVALGSNEAAWSQNRRGVTVVN
ncbi:MAG: peptidoglycan-associated lipoprotein Pal [Alphaproteobacteria bacterium]|nr:peptidoglycan-associated lipoprotein Pal [Alphaproteobacteria bacterium]